MQGIRIGELLVERGILTSRRVEHLLKIQQRVHRPLGVLAIEFYGVDPKCVEEAWVRQYVRMIGVIDLSHHEIDPYCLKLVSARQAHGFHVLPLCQIGEDLHMATSLEHFAEAMRFVSDQVKEPAILHAAEDGQLGHFIDQCYPGSEAGFPPAALTPEA